MPSQETIGASVQPFLPQGELFHAAFALQAGPHPLLPVVNPFCWFLVKRRLVVVTNEAIYLCELKLMSGFVPQQMLAHYRLGTRFACNEAGQFSKFFLKGSRYWIRRRDYADVATADQLSVELAEAQSKRATSAFSRLSA